MFHTDFPATLTLSFGSSLRFQVNLTTTSDVIRSDLVLDIELAWVYQNSFQLFLDMQSLFQDSGVDTDGAIGQLGNVTCDLWRIGLHISRR